MPESLDAALVLSLAWKILQCSDKLRIDVRDGYLYSGLLFSPRGVEIAKGSRNAITEKLCLAEASRTIAALGRNCRKIRRESPAYV